MKPLVPIEQLETFAEGLDHPEGICITPNGEIYVGGEAGQLYRIASDDSVVEVLTTGGWLLGLAADAAGRIYACDAAKRCVWRIDPLEKSLDVFTNGTEARRMVAPNWGCFDVNAYYYVSDSGQWKGRNGVIWRITPNGSGEVWTEEARDFPNGMAVSEDCRHLYVLESTPGALVRFEINADGSAGPRELMTDLPRAVPDGIAFTTDGSAVISCYRPDVVYRWRPDVGVAVLAEDPEGVALAAPTNVVFVGRDLGCMVVPNIGRWHLTRFRHPALTGIPLHYPTREQLGA